MSDLSPLFTRVVCVNLRRRPERWQAFQAEMKKADWPFGPVERVNAIDGQLVPAPTWFTVGEASYTWGCLVSHLRIWEDAINDGTESVLVFEDDAVLCDDFTSQAERFLSQVPADWDLLFLGGHHCPDTVPIRINEQVFRPEASWRTHGYAVRGEFIKTLYQHVCQFNAPGRFTYPGAYHVDHQIAELMRDVKVRAFCPPRWLVGQRSDFSEIAQGVRHDSTEYYNNINPIQQGRYREM